MFSKIYHKNLIINHLELQITERAALNPSNNLIHCRGSYHHDKSVELTLIQLDSPIVYTFQLALLSSWFLMGNSLILIPVAAKIALHTAGAMPGVAGSPAPPVK